MASCHGVTGTHVSGVKRHWWVPPVSPSLWIQTGLTWVNTHIATHTHTHTYTLCDNAHTPVVIIFLLTWQVTFEAAHNNFVCVFVCVHLCVSKNSILLAINILSPGSSTKHYKSPADEHRVIILSYRIENGYYLLQLRNTVLWGNVATWVSSGERLSETRVLTWDIY